ncbi:aspartyl-phosphate phosphatase Spo0E family protein [Paenibacillus sp. HJGM_3]|uniref:aspartyl-phosphate phosphatase Spo0E family protein n=1 Tax=Paenibacillus sp. HJGM_3 TaxID=3379816 RepID=UPI0038701164
MHNEAGLQKQILRMQKRLEATVKRYEFNFVHPRVLELSERLDRLIVQYMNRHPK